MLLAIDVGNTNIVFALYAGNIQKGMWRCMTESARTSDEYLAFLSQHFELKNLKVADVTDVIVSSVVPDVDFSIEKLARDGFGIGALFVGRDTPNLGIDIKIDRPAELGADRLVNTFAVHRVYQCAAIVIDFGTATTFDVVDAQGAFCGGVIAPGPNLSMEALYMAAAKLPRVGVEKPRAAIAKNTVEAMRSGVFWGYVGLVEKILDKLIAELGSKPKIIATGGLATLFQSDIPAIDVIDEDLTLKGLLGIYQHMKNK
jgi:type III pantothenate kinase